MLTRRIIFHPIAFILLSVLGLSPLTAGAAAATLWVANNGVDSGTCGSRDKPCRSISQAIENAVDGDTIEVGEGRYGDISGSGTFTGGGDEHGQSLIDSTGCMICINKAVRILSLHGSAVTLIQGNPTSQFNAANQVVSSVAIINDGVTFGTPGHGFTLTGGNSYGVMILLNPTNDFVPFSIVRPIHVDGNIDAGDRTGFQYFGPDFVSNFCPVCTFSGVVTFSDDEADGNGAVGFSIQLGLNDSEPIILQNDVARNTGTGFAVAAGVNNEIGLFFGSAANVSLLNNISTGNGSGFNVRNSAGDIRNNVASGNKAFGFYVVPGNASFTGNSAIGNGGPGAIVQYSNEFDDTILGPGFRSFSGNNFFANDRNRPDITILVVGDAAFDIGPGAHCAVVNLGLLAAPQSHDQPMPGPAVTLNAADNFWGSTTGPSPSGPGDAVGGPCDQNNATTTAKKFSTVFL